MTRWKPFCVFTNSTAYLYPFFSDLSIFNKSYSTLLIFNVSIWGFYSLIIFAILAFSIFSMSILSFSYCILSVSTCIRISLMSWVEAISRMLLRVNSPFSKRRVSSDLVGSQKSTWNSSLLIILDCKMGFSPSLRISIENLLRFLKGFRSMKDSLYPSYRMKLASSRLVKFLIWVKSSEILRLEL